MQALASSSSSILRARLFNGQSSYDLVDQWQWAIFMWNGATWDCIGN